VGDVLLTSAHPSHAAAVHLFAHATLWVAEQDEPLLSRDRLPGAPLARALARLRRSGSRRRARLVRPGELLSAAGLSLSVVHLPCVTPGSVAYVLDGVALTGSALLARGGGVEPPSWLLAESPKRCVALLPRLRQWELGALATATGVLEPAEPALARLSGATAAPR
jgi:glyoxylase-like metal-dependent hydrolase (beta-lactamase superfamily II)